MDDLALDRQLTTAADEALHRMNYDEEAATVLLSRWIEAGSVGTGLRERLLKDYITVLVSERKANLISQEL